MNLSKKITFSTAIVMVILCFPFGMFAQQTAAPTDMETPFEETKTTEDEETKKGLQIISYSRFEIKRIR